MEKNIVTRISFYSCNTHPLPPKPKSSFRHLKRGIQDFHMSYALVPANTAADSVIHLPPILYLVYFIRYLSYKLYCWLDKRCPYHSMYLYQVNMKLHFLYDAVDDVELTRKSIITP